MAVGKLSGQEKRDLLATHSLFEGLPLSVLDRLAAHARAASFAEGARIFEKGDPGLSLMLVLEGIVKISIFSDEGKEVVLNLIRVGEILGEIAILDGEKRTADAWALRDVTLLVIDRRTVETLVDATVARLYHETIRAARRAEIAAEAAGVASRLRELLDRRVALGESSPLEALKARSEWFARRRDALDAAHTLDAARSALEVFCGRRLPAGAPLEEPRDEASARALPSDLQDRLPRTGEGVRGGDDLVAGLDPDGVEGRVDRGRPGVEQEARVTADERGPLRFEGRHLGCPDAAQHAALEH